MSDQSKPFTDMAAAIEHNAETSKFGGAAVIVPPDGSGQIEILMLDAQGDVGLFWGTLKTRIDIIIAELQQRQAVAAAYGRR